MNDKKMSTNEKIKNGVVLVFLAFIAFIILAVVFTSGDKMGKYLHNKVASEYEPTLISASYIPYTYSNYEGDEKTDDYVDIYIDVTELPKDYKTMLKTQTSDFYEFKTDGTLYYHLTNFTLKVKGEDKYQCVMSKSHKTPDCYNLPFE